MPVIAPMLAKLGYDPYANPPNYGKPDQKVVENTRRVRLLCVHLLTGVLCLGWAFEGCFWYFLLLHNVFSLGENEITLWGLQLSSLVCGAEPLESCPESWGAGYQWKKLSCLHFRLDGRAQLFINEAWQKLCHKITPQTLGRVWKMTHRKQPTMIKMSDFPILWRTTQRWRKVWC